MLANNGHSIKWRQAQKKKKKKKKAQKITSKFISRSGIELKIRFFKPDSWKGRSLFLEEIWFWHIYSLTFNIKHRIKRNNSWIAFSKSKVKTNEQLTIVCTLNYVTGNNHLFLINLRCQMFQFMTYFSFIFALIYLSIWLFYPSTLLF